MEVLHADIKVPSKLEDLTPQWLSTVLGLQVSPKDFQLTSNIQGGMGYLSSMQRISCYASSSDGNDSKNNADQKLDVVLKFLPSGESEFEQWSREMAVVHELDKTEINVYMKIIPDLIQVLPEFSKYICKFHVGIVTENPRDSIIVLQDLKPLGYSSRNFAEDMTRTQVEDAIKFSAKFHYAASALGIHKKMPLTQVYPFLRDRAADIQAMSGIVQDGYSQLDDFFAEQNCSQSFRDYFKSFQSDHVVIFEKILTAAYKPVTLCHGDLWSNNIMVMDKKDEQAESSIKIIDWQLVGLSDPVTDLAILIISVLPPSHLKKDIVERLLKLYFDTYCEYCQNNGLEELITGDYAAFSKNFYTLGMAYALIWFTLSRHPFATSFGRLVRIYEFFQQEVNIASYLLTLA